MGASNVRASKWFELACIGLLAATIGLLGVSAAPPSAADLVHCPKSCGDVNISYPFGIGRGCFRPDFEVTCNRSTGTPKLFLGNTTTEIFGQAQWGDAIMASIILNVDTKRRGPPGTIYNMSWEAPGKSLSIFTRTDETFMVIVGCGVEAYLFDTANLSNVLGYCATMCDNLVALENEAQGRICHGMGCCTIEFQWSMRAFTLSIIEKDVKVPLALANTTVKAFLSYVDYDTAYNFSMADLISDKVNTSTIGSVWAYLSPIITDQPNCRTAQVHDQYACAFGNCVDYTDDESGGYSCSCTNDVFDEGNPYVVDGCNKEYKPSQEKLNCSRLCGNTSIPFPFGLEPGCSGNWNFLLNCTANQLLFGQSRVQYPVASISVDEGVLSVKSPLDTQDANKRMTEIYITSFGASLEFYQELVDFDITEQSSTWKWAISNKTCAMAKNDAEYACISANSECINVTHGHFYIGYRCKCKLGYEGNPYVRNGCNDTNECLIPYVCNGTCYNWDGGYNCTGCPHGKSFDPARRQCTSTDHRSLIFAVAIGLGCGFGVLALTLSITILTQQWKQHIKKKFEGNTSRGTTVYS